MATAGNSVSLNTTGTTLFSADTDNQGAGCRAYSIRNLDSTNHVLVNIPGLHASGEFFGLAPGERHTFRHWGNVIKSVFAKASASTVNIHHGIAEQI